MDGSVTQWNYISVCTVLPAGTFTTACVKKSYKIYFLWPCNLFAYNVIDYMYNSVGAVAFVTCLFMLKIY